MKSKIKQPNCKQKKNNQSLVGTGTVSLQENTEFNAIDQDSELIEEHEHNPDHVKVSVNANEENEFASEGEEELESDTETLPSEAIPGILESDSVVTFNVNTGCRTVSSKAPVTGGMESDQFQHLESNPAFQRYIQGLVAKEVQANRTSGTPVKEGRDDNFNSNRIMKSPSDTMIYAPLLVRKDVNLNRKQDTPIEEQVSRFVENIRLNNLSPGQKRNACDGEVLPGPSRLADLTSDGLTDGDHNRAGDPQPRDDMDARVQLAKDKAQNLIVEAEQFKTAVNLLQSIADNPFYHSEGPVREDDDFFHITCHVDPVIKGKIKRGGICRA